MSDIRPDQNLFVVPATHLWLVEYMVRGGDIKQSYVLTANPSVMDAEREIKRAKYYRDDVEWTETIVSAKWLGRVANNPFIPEVWNSWPFGCVFRRSLTVPEDLVKAKFPSVGVPAEEVDRL